MRRVALPIAILLVSILITGVLLRTPTAVLESAPEIIPVSVRVTEVKQQSVQLLVESQGRVQAAQLCQCICCRSGSYCLDFSFYAGGCLC